jgi:hypothetical protein
VREERVPLEPLDDRRDPVVPADPQVVALRDVVGEHHPRVLADAREHGEEHVPFERLGLVDDHEGVVQGAATDVRQGQHLDQAALDHLVEHVVRDHRTEGVVDGLRPRVHLLAGVTRQEAEVLPAHGVQRPEHHDLLVLLPFEHRFESGAQGERRLAGAGTAAERDDADLGVEQRVDREPLLGRAPAEAEDLTVAAHQGDCSGDVHAAERRSTLGVDDDPGVHGDAVELRGADLLFLVQVGHLLAGHLQVGDAGVARVDREFGAVLLGRHADRRRLDPERQVLRHDDDVEPVVLQVRRDGEDAGVVVAELQARRQDGLVGVVQFDAERAAVADRDREVEPLVFDAQFVEQPEGLPGEVPDLRVVALRFEFADDHHGQDHGVLGEAEQGPRIAEEHRCVEHVCALGDRCGRVRGVLFLCSARDVLRGHDHSIPGPRRARSCPRTRPRSGSRSTDCGRFDRARCPMGTTYVRPPTPRQRHAVSGVTVA